MPPLIEQRLAVRQRPDRPAVMYQQWRRLLFLHWSWDPERIEATLPPGLHLDTFDGKAYLGIVPFFMRRVRPRFCPPVPLLSDFLELNVRTYVYDDSGRPGIWFYSLDCDQPVAVMLARALFHLPYFRASMRATIEDASGTVGYASLRSGCPRALETRFTYRPVSAPFEAEPGTLEFFLIERYLLFSYSRRRKALYSGRVFHHPYPLTAVAAPQNDARPLELDGFGPCETAPDHAVMSFGVDVNIYPLEKVA